MTTPQFANPETQAEAEGLEKRLHDAEAREAARREDRHWSPLVGQDVDGEDAQAKPET